MCGLAVLTAWSIRLALLTASSLYPQWQVVSVEVFKRDITPGTFHSLQSHSTSPSTPIFNPHIPSPCPSTLNSTARRISTRPSRRRANTSSSTATRMSPPNRLRSENHMTTPVLSYLLTPGTDTPRSSPAPPSLTWLTSPRRPMRG